MGVGHRGLLSSLCASLVCVVFLCVCALSDGSTALDLVWSHGWDSCVGVRKVIGVGCGVLSSRLCDVPVCVCVCVCVCVWRGEGMFTQFNLS